MKYWEPQMALFQPVPIHVDLSDVDNPRYSLASPDDNATIHETRFLCYFHNDRNETATTFSVYPFNYEFVSWRKHRGIMFEAEGAKGDTSKLELSQLVFACPIPTSMMAQAQPPLQVDKLQHVAFYLDLVPIRTPARRQFMLTEDHVGPTELRNMKPFDALKHYGPRGFHVLPDVKNSGRWANLPVCLPPKAPVPDDIPASTTITTKKHRLVACTWAAASYHRRGDVTAVHDTAKRLREWIAFHRLVGFDHLYIYDNTQPLPNAADEESTASLPLQTIATQEDERFVTYIRWKPTICNNNRPQHAVPGERSSQYAAEASCRARYGPHTDWLVFMDIDEYLVPMGNNLWHGVLDQADQDGVKVLKLKSARGRPRHSLMAELPLNAMPDVCENLIDTKVRVKPEPCLVARSNETFLRVYNCDFIKLPRPERFSRAMKQIYRPDFVFQHFVHYSCVTRPIATYYKDRIDKDTFQKRVKDSEW